MGKTPLFYGRHALSPAARACALRPPFCGRADHGPRDIAPRHVSRRRDAHHVCACAGLVDGAFRVRVLGPHEPERSGVARAFGGNSCGECCPCGCAFYGAQPGYGVAVGKAHVGGVLGVGRPADVSAGAVVPLWGLLGAGQGVL